jgi:hypothetical protein
LALQTFTAQTLTAQTFTAQFITNLCIGETRGEHFFEGNSQVVFGHQLEKGRQK